MTLDWTNIISQNTFYEFAAILVFAALLGGIGQLLRQPLIVIFILLGILVGPAVLDIVKSKDNIHLLAEVGITILLFIVGLKLDLRVIHSVGKIALLTGLGQVVFTSIIGYLIGLLLGFEPLHSFYIAVALTFSSTIIIVKLLSDKKEIDSLHGQIAVGFLIVQDIVVILVMVILSALRRGMETSLIAEMGHILLSGFVLLLITIVSMKWVIPRLSMFFAKSQEMLVLFALACALLLAVIGELLGFSGEVGAFLAGVSLASSQLKDVISSRLTSIRDFLLLFFFVDLGSTLDLSVIGNQVFPSIIFSLFVLIGNPLIVMIIMGLMGYRKRTSFLAGLTVAQISEFSLIFAGMGLAIGHITLEVSGLITLVGLITIALSTYMILYSHQLYELVAPALNIFQKKKAHREDDLIIGRKKCFDVIIVGLGRFGSKLAEMLEAHPEITYLGVDFDPAIVSKWQNEGKNIHYGDLEDPDLVELLPFEQAKIIISTVPDYQLSKQLMRFLKRKNFRGKVFLVAVKETDLQELSDCGATEVLMPHQMAASNFYNTYLKPLFEKENCCE